MAVGNGRASNTLLRSYSEDRAVERVGAPLADDIDLRGRESVVGRIGSALNLEFLDRVLRQDHRRGNQGRVSVDQAVESVVIAFGAAAVDADRVAFALAHRALFTADGDGARTHQEQLHEVAPVQRKLFHLLLADQLRQRGAVGIQITACAVTSMVSVTAPGFKARSTRTF